jgi:type IV pilus biogenesis protein CpaD/CtpE
MTRLALAAAVLLAGCQESEPYSRANSWQPTGANAGNIGAMAVRPTDLIRGRSTTRSDARQGADAVDRVWQGRARALPAPSSTAPQSAAPAPASGTPN